jgi:hypothetical protein
MAVGLRCLLAAGGVRVGPTARRRVNRPPIGAALAGHRKTYLGRDQLDGVGPWWNRERAIGGQFPRGRFDLMQPGLWVQRRLLTCLLTEVRGAGPIYVAPAVGVTLLLIHRVR